VLKSHSKDTEADIKYMATQVTMDDSDQYVISDEGKRFLAKENIWLMVLDGKGEVKCEYDLPENLNKNYVISEVAQFSNWYLDGYPIVEKIMDEGLLVLGYKQDNVIGISITKVYYADDTKNIICLWEEAWLS